MHEILRGCELKALSQLWHYVAICYKCTSTFIRLDYISVNA